MLFPIGYFGEGYFPPGYFGLATTSGPSFQPQQTFGDALLGGDTLVLLPEPGELGPVFTIPIAHLYEDPL